MGARNRLVTLAAAYRPVYPEQRKIRLGMVEAVHFGPGTRIVTGLTPECGSIRSAARHPVPEFTVMRILMAGRAGFVRKMEGQDLVRAVSEPLFVALVARDGGMGAGQREFGLLVHGNRKERSLKALHRVALFAAIVVRRTGKLPVVRVFVAVGAIRKLDVVDGVFPGGNVTLRAFHGGVLSLERIT